MNINDSDMDPESLEPIIERTGFTEMTKVRVSHLVFESANSLGYSSPTKGQDESLQAKTWEDNEKLVLDLERKLENEIIICCDAGNPLAWLTVVVIRLIMSRLRLAIYHPQSHNHRYTSHRHISRDIVLEAAVQNLEYGHLLITEPAAAKWRWYANTRVQWHALAATLAELCVQDKGPLVERGWKIVDAVFEGWAAHIADSTHGMLWRPIQKLMKKAQARRNEYSSRSLAIVPQQQQRLPEYELPSYSHFQTPSVMATSFPQDLTSNVVQQSLLNRPLNFDQELPSNVLASLTVTDTMDTINWAEWDEFMQDFERGDQSAPIDANVVAQGGNGVWW